MADIKRCAQAGGMFVVHTAAEPLVRCVCLSVVRFIRTLKQRRLYPQDRARSTLRQPRRACERTDMVGCAATSSGRVWQIKVWLDTSPQNRQESLLFKWRVTPPFIGPFRWFLSARCLPSRLSCRV